MTQNHYLVSVVQTEKKILNQKGRILNNINKGLIKN